LNQAQKGKKKSKEISQHGANVNLKYTADRQPAS